MKTGFFASMAAIASVSVVLTLASVSVAGQTPKATAQTWNPPRTPDGQPDIQGYWIPQGPTAAMTFPTYTLEGGHPFDEEQTVIAGANAAGANAQQWSRALKAQSVVIDPPSGKIPYQPWALAKRQETLAAHTHPTKPEQIDGRARCYLAGVPATTYGGDSQIVQTAGYVVLLQEFGHAPRIIPLDGRPHLGENIRLWQGDSRGHWNGNTLIVETTNTNAKLFDHVGDFHSDAARVVEHFTFDRPDTIRYAATIHDPTVFTRPWTIGLTLRRNTEPGFELLEEACIEGERDSKRMLHSTPAAKPGDAPK
jgi:hypothetical protein